MKRILALIFSLLMLFSAFGCKAEEEKTSELSADGTATAESVTEEGESTAEPEEVTTEAPPPVYDEKVETLLPPLFEKLPIANASMSVAELRQLCVDYVCLSVSFQWVPAKHFSYVTSSKDVEVSFYEGKLYGGIPYINTASGNLYRILEYYDEETGVLDTSFFSENPHLFGTACSGTAATAWQRVVNSAEISWTHSMNPIHGFVPVGPYRYDYSKPIIWKKKPDGKREHFYNTKTVCKENGEQVMFESYAMTLPADCYSSNGHVRMLARAPRVFRNEDGTIDGEKSTVELVEQGLYTKGDYHVRKNADGKEYLIRGCDGKFFTFRELFEAGYLVHTFREFLGIDPVEKSEIAFVFEGEEKTVATGTVACNYPISDVFFSVKDGEGKEIFSHIHRHHPHYVKAIPLTRCLPDGLPEEGTLEVYAQISTGEKLHVYTGPVLK
ncbi:MAG: hypothetical protein IKC69_05480 [Clostridia bacterium]|nr:hypothetical protein [Clostridia bacterium]